MQATSKRIHTRCCPLYGHQMHEIPPPSHKNRDNQIVTVSGQRSTCYDRFWFRTVQKQITQPITPFSHFIALKHFTIYSTLEELAVFKVPTNLAKQTNGDDSRHLEQKWQLLFGIASSVLHIW